MKPQRTIVLCLVAVLAVNSGKQLKKGKVPGVDLGVGAALSGTLLLGLAEFLPDVAKGLAIVMLLTGLLGAGDEQVKLMKTVTGLAAGKPK